jgi:protein-histidine pros-kinase
MGLGETTAFPTSVESSLLLMESAPDAVVIVAGDGLIRFVNGQAERLFGYGRDELIGRSVDELVPARFRIEHAHHRDEYFDKPRTRPMGAGLDLFGRRKDGSEFNAEISLSPLRIEGTTYVVSAIRDVTDRKAVERELSFKNAELESANKAKDRFLASMSHELRTPLNAIIGFTGTLLMKLPGPLTPDQEQQLRIVQSSARHLLSLINDILDLAKVESGKLELYFEPVSVAEVVGEVNDSLRSMAHDKGLTLSVTEPPSQISVTTDRRALHQILLNLVNNAIKYTESGTVSVRFETSGEGAGRRVSLHVSDTGIGIKPEDQKRLFQAFEQLDASSTRRFEGVGLGLYLSEKLAKMIGGVLSFESVYGRGSTFTLVIPVDRH